MSGSAGSLAGFLLARIAEDEARGGLPKPEALETLYQRHLRFEVLSKRKVIESADATTLRALGLPYADHPDYRAEEWAV